MSDFTEELLCPFSEIIDKRVLGEASDDDEAKLEKHLAGGCPTCAPRLAQEEKLEQLVLASLEPLAAEAASRKKPFLEKLDEQLAREDDRRKDRRLRRIGMNAVLLLTVLLGVVLISVNYVMFSIATKKLTKAQRETAKVELQAILVAVNNYQTDHGGKLPQDEKELAAFLSEPRASGRPYFSPSRTKDGLIADPWDRPYFIQSAPDGVVLVSHGPNRRSDEGLGDDLVHRLMVVKPPK